MSYNNSTDQSNQPNITMPRPATNRIKNYTALITQSGTDAPTVTELQNQLGGTIVWTRIMAGQYHGTLVGAFPEASTTVLVAQNKATGNNSQAVMRASDDYVYIRTYNNAGALTDGLLTGTLIEIRVYS